MERGGGLSTWIGREVAVELRDLPAPRQGSSGSGSFEQRVGTLHTVDELGIELDEHPVGTSATTQRRFYPWSAVRSLAPTR
jgi:hypothetical protein